ncbi:MAG TPA: ATP-dependent helicase, partial [Sphingomicrobium sp.]|nr:ATP-dependent helicase [Sphingomicrobium sp.]
TARAGADGRAIAFCSPDERLNLRDIERLTRMKIDVEPLPDGFVAAAQAFKALKLPTAPRDERGPGRGGFGGRRDGGHRHGRPSAPRAAIQPTGERRNGEQRSDGPTRKDGQRHPQRAGGHPAHRPEGSAGKRTFRGRRGGQGRPNRAHA